MSVIPPSRLSAWPHRRRCTSTNVRCTTTPVLDHHLLGIQTARHELSVRDSRPIFDVVYGSHNHTIQHLHARVMAGWLMLGLCEVPHHFFSCPTGCDMIMVGFSVPKRRCPGLRLGHMSRKSSHEMPTLVLRLCALDEIAKWLCEPR
jgi:hypothetical protein